MVDFSSVRAIDFHTHAEEPCGCHVDDGYDDLQAGMAKYFGAPWSHPPTIDQTAAHFRAANIAAVIFPVDAERETGYRRYSNFEVAEACARHSDILIPFASIDPAKGKLGAREARTLVELGRTPFIGARGQADEDHAAVDRAMQAANVEMFERRIVDTLFSCFLLNVLRFLDTIDDRSPRCFQRFDLDGTSTCKSRCHLGLLNCIPGIFDQHFICLLVKF